MTAKVKTATFWADCGNCGEALVDDEYGSQMIEISAVTLETQLKCINCGASNSLPKKLFTK